MNYIQKREKSMKNKRLGVSAKFVSAVAAVYAVLIIALSFSFQHILKANSDILKEVLLANNESFLLKKTAVIIDGLPDAEIKNLGSLAWNVYKSCKDDENIFWVFIYSRTSDENFFKVRKKIPFNTLIKPAIKETEIVKEKKNINYIKKAMIERAIDPVIYSSKGVYWQSVYYPYKIQNHTFVIEFFISSLKISTALNEYSEVINKTKKNILYITSIATVIVIIITLLFIHNFNHIIRNLSRYMRRAAEGELNISLKQTGDDDLNELASSFNTMISELKGLKEKEAVIKDMEKKDSLNDLFKFGVNMLRENRFDDSIHIFKTLTMLKPDGFGSYFNLGVAFAKKKDYNTSLDMFKRALESSPENELTLSYIEKVKRLQNLNEKNSRQYQGYN